MVENSEKPHANARDGGYTSDKIDFPMCGKIDHVRRLSEAQGRVQEAVRASRLPRDLSELYIETLNDLLGILSPEALRRHCQNTVGYRFYGSHNDLMEAYRREWTGVEFSGIVKGAYDPQGKIHLNGGGTYVNREACLAEFYAHEVTHSIDGLGHEISTTKQWKTAWEAEKQVGVLTKIGRKSPAEGFAEFGQFLLGAVDVTEQQLAEVLPECFRVWKEFGL